MDEQSSIVSQMRAVTVSREYGSGGGEVASRLAVHLGWQLIDHEIVGRVAQELDISVAEAEAYDERIESTVTLILNSMRTIHPAMFAVAPEPLATDSRTYRDALTRVVEAAIATQHTVIVGRGSQVLLADRRDVLHVRIVAPLEERIAYVMQREGLDQGSAQARIQIKEHDRQRYLQSSHHHHPDDAHLYDLILNTHILDLDSIVELITMALERKAGKLSTPQEELGPAAGLPRYPGRPGDFRPPQS